MRALYSFIFFNISVLAFAQTNLYVNSAAPTGGNGSFNSPFNTIQNAVNSASHNSFTIINVFGGTYHENIWIAKSGVPSGYFTIKPYQKQIVTLDGTNQFSKEALIIQSVNYVRIEGLIIQNYIADFAKGIGIYCKDGNTSNIEIIDNELRNINVNNTTASSNPIVCYGHSTINNNYFISNVLIANNKVHNCDTGVSESIQINYDTRNFEIRNNQVYSNTNIGIVAAGYHGGVNKRASNGRIWQNKVYNCASPHAPAAGIYLDGASNVIIEQNISYQNQVGIQVGCENAGFESTGIIVRNNLIYNNSNQGLGIGGILETAHGIVNNSNFVNNTLFNNNTVFNADFGEIYFTKAQNCIIKNNIIYGKKHYVAVMMKVQYPPWFISNSFDYNLYFSDSNSNSTEAVFKWGEGPLWDFNTYKLQTSKEANSILGNPLFVNSALPQPELHIKSSSNNAINKGDNSLSTTIVGTIDFDGNNRANDRIDIGAYEFYNCPSKTNIYGNISGNTIMKGVEIKASNIVSGNNNFYRSTSNTELKPGFRTENGSVFTVQIQTCN